PRLGDPSGRGRAPAGGDFEVGDAAGGSICVGGYRQYVRRRHPLLRFGVRRVKVLHTSDWHVGKVLRGQPRAEEHVKVLAEVVRIARAERPDLVVVAGDLYDSAAPSPESTRIVTRALSALRRHAGPGVRSAGNPGKRAA